MQDEKRIEVIQRVFRGELAVGSAAVVLGISERQCYRIKRRVKEQGAKGVVHGNRGRPCKRKVKEKTVRRILELARGKYRGFNDQHLTDSKSTSRSSSVVRRSGGSFAPTGSPLRESAVPQSTAAAETDVWLRG
jgi:transposase